MALVNPSNIYAAGAVTIPTQQNVNMYAQILAKKQAREEALDEYERNRINRINETGLRDQDREGLDKMVMDLRGYYQSNKDAIKRGNSAAAYEYEKKFRDALGYISKSKDATAKAETFNKIRLERQKMGRATPEDWFDDYVANENPIISQEHKPLDLSKYMSQSAPKYDSQKVLKGFADIKRTPGTPRYEAIPGDKYGRNKFIDETFDPNAKITIAARAHDLYDADDGFAYEVQQDYDNPIKRGQLEQVSIKEFGTSPKSMADYAAAKIISQLQPTISGKPKYEPLFEERQKLLQGYKQQNIATYQWYRRQDRANQDYFIDAIVDDNLVEAQQNPDNTFNPSPAIKKDLGFMGKIPADNFRIENGVIKFNDGEKEQTMSMDTYKAHLRKEFTAKGTEPQVQKANTDVPKVKYTQITETNKGTIGVKNGKWYYIKTGKPVE